MIDPRHPAYNFVNLAIDLKFGDLCINFKADTLLKVLQFIASPPSEEIDKSASQKAKGGDVSPNSQQ